MTRLPFRAALLCAFLASPPALAAQAPLLSGIFGDHGVLQRDRPIALWGQATPGEVVSVALGDSRTTATADGEGRWTAALPARGAGGPFRLVATAGALSQTVEDVMVGDVWLCSGQSNMEWPVSRALNGAAEVAGANDPGIRLLAVAKDTSPSPLNAFKSPVTWKVTTPESAADFSAVCYFMARELRKAENVPLGLVNASWGGTAINPWRSEQAIRAAGDEPEKLDILAAYRRDPVQGNRRFGAAWEQWYRNRTGNQPGTEPWQPRSLSMWKDVPHFGPWEEWGDPELASYNGMVWYATDVRLTSAQARQKATISIGSPDEIGQTWVNGVAVGNSYGGDGQSYDLAAGLLKPGLNRIVVNVLDTWAQGGLRGSDDQRQIRLADGTTVPLAGAWKYRREEKSPGSPPRAPWESNGGLSSIYNAMIAPLGRYGLKGIAWYQGESDTGAAGSYATRLTSLMRDWRSQFAAPDLPFLTVQLAGFGPAATKPVESGTATLRDQQRRSVMADPHAALTVTVDLGDRIDIHPVTKQQVGTRLARAARSLAYGATSSPSGAEVIGARRNGNAVTVSFGKVEGSLATFSGASAIAFELCGEVLGSCRFVDAQVGGSEVRLVAQPGLPAERVRFCWGDSPICNLTDASGLPVGPFEVSVED